MNIRAFKSVLERLEKLYAAAGATSPARDLRGVSKLLDGHEDKAVDAYVAETKAALAADQRGTADPEAVVTAHARQLLDAGTDQDAFDFALAAVEQDDRVGKSEWSAIANRYRNQPSGVTHIRKFGSVKEARQAISDVFGERLDARSKRGIISKLTKRAS